ncbi:MAG: radical SAM protein [Candidatus Bathyarchaeia archaeon]
MSNPEVVPPVIVSFAITRLCNLRCPHCYSDSVNTPHPKELNTEEAKRVVGEIADAGARLIIFDGGEPTMRGDLVELVRHARDVGLRPLLGSHGMLITERLARELREAGLRQVAISLDGAKPETHDAFRGMKGAWEATMQGIKNCAKAGLPFQIAPCLHKKNWKELADIVEMAKQLNTIAIEIFDFIASGRGEKYAAEYELSTEERRLLHKTEESGKITKEEKRLLKAFQDGIRLVSQPFATVAGMVGKSENDVLSTIKSLLKRGVIRRVGAVVRHRAAGFTANALVAWKVPPETLGDVRGKMARFEEITHCYERLTVPGKWEYNVFCMAHGRSKEECEEVIKRISKEIGIQEYVVLYSGREFKTAGVRVN